MSNKKETRGRKRGRKLVHSITVLMTPEQHMKLKSESERRMIPVAQLIREAI